MKVGDNVVLVIDGDIKGATVLEVMPNGEVKTSLKDWDGDFLTFERRLVFTAAEWEAVRGEFA
jgi:hypothetical protein